MGTRAFLSTIAGSTMAAAGVGLARPGPRSQAVRRALEELRRMEREVMDDLLRGLRV